MFKKLRLTSKIENALMLTFTLIFLIFISISPDMNLESLKGVLIIGITVGIIYGLVAVGISLIYTGLDVVNFSITSSLGFKDVAITILSINTLRLSLSMCQSSIGFPDIFFSTFP